ncbi:hypothetical protein ANO11243_066670 [Dothideomycetidae sp. 11243]|nr:hypothetical protein ANO11243_066670 [fungal sp. No.11243]
MRLLVLSILATNFLIPGLAASDRYIVTLSPHVLFDRHKELLQGILAKAPRQQRPNQAFDGIFRYYSIPGFQAYAARFDINVVDQLRRHADVLAIERDQEFAIPSTPPEYPNDPECDSDRKEPAHTLQPDAFDLGPAQISHRGTNEKGVYWYDQSAGQGTYGYVVDSGVNIHHAEFESRAFLGHNAVENAPFRDDEGHGTHVASTVCGKTYGVAKKCNIIAVKIAHGGKSSRALLLDGYTWAVKDILDKRRQSKAVINISWSLPGPSAAHDHAVNAAFAKGVTTVVAAGNSKQHAGLTWPTSAGSAIVVAASTCTRKSAGFSNYGPNVTLFAPGTYVRGAWIGFTGNSNTATAWLSGTSMAAPHVSGLVLYFKGLGGLASAKATKKYIVKMATRDVVKNVKDTPNLFAYNGSGK